MRDQTTKPENTPTDTSNYSRNSRPVTGIIDRLRGIGRQKGKVTLGEITHALRYRSYGPFLLVPGLAGISPLGAIPGMPTLLALIVVLFAGQIVLGRHHIWLPDFLENIAVSGARLETAMKKIYPVARWLDRHFHERLQGLFTPRTIRIAAIICLLLVLPMPLLEVIPLAAVMPMIAVSGFGLAMILRDGVVMIAAGILVIAALIACLVLMV